MNCRSLKLIEFTADEIREVRAAIELGHTSWTKYSGDNYEISTLKQKIKRLALERTGHKCCYCRKNLFGEFGYVIDIEHILPKSKFLNYMFVMKNLSASCKRCNMQIKGNKVDFLNRNEVEVRKKPFISSNYKFIHPNIDKYIRHLKLIQHQEGDEIFLKYVVINSSDKGQFTYEYFALNRVEIDTFQKIQGIDGIAEPINTRVKELIDEYGTV